MRTAAKHMIPVFAVILGFTAGELFGQIGQARVVGRNAALHAGPGSGTSVLIELPMGAALEVEEIIGDWARVKVAQDFAIMLGYVEVSALELFTGPAQAPMGLGADDNYSAWEERISLAKRNFSGGIRLAISGVAVIVPSIAIGAHADRSKSTHPLSRIFGEAERISKKNLLICGCAFGACLVVAGTAMCLSESFRLARLNEEGKAQGYVKAGLLPEYGGLGIQVRAGF